MVGVVIFHRGTQAGARLTSLYHDTDWATHTRTHRRMSANAFNRCVIAWVRVFVLAEQCMTFDWMYACGDSFYVLLRHIWQNIHTYVIKAARRPWQNAHRLCHRLRTAAKPVEVDFVYRQTAALLTEALINYGWVCWAPAKRWNVVRWWYKGG